ncbi:MAG TPA: HupV protein [Nitrospirae bacterium]|nr:HupV protein [Nitrospirota bacterium]
MSKHVTLTPFSRVEGDLRIKVTIDSGAVTDARASGVMFRGFEKILRNHYPEDALVFTPRICGICCISHSIAASSALGSISEDFTPSRSGLIAKNIAHATENAMSHITQFYLYFAPDLLNSKYKGLKHHDLIKSRFEPLKGKSVTEVMAERKRFIEILGLIVGKWPHTLAIHPGGITKSLESSTIFRLRGVLASFISVVEGLITGVPVDEYLNIKTVSDLEALYSGNEKDLPDIGLFYRFAKEAGLMEMGRWQGIFLSAGAYRQPDGSFYIPPGFWDNGLSPLDPGIITESIKYSFFNNSEDRSGPLEDFSEPKWNKPGAYSWAKAPRYGGRVVEVGALGRQVICNDGLILDLLSRYGSTVFTRAFARLHEAVKLLSAIGSWIDQLGTEDGYYAGTSIRKDASGMGLTEAARGFLGHWISVEGGKIKNYQVITPTAWNCSPRDENDNPGALEQALIGCSIADVENPVEIDHIIRSFDPCLVCTVH